MRHFIPYSRYDFEHTTEDQQKLEMFCMLTNSIEKNVIGNTLKDYILSLNIVKDALEYINMHAPCFKPTLLRTDSDELKDFISKPALKYILRYFHWVYVTLIYLCILMSKKLLFHLCIFPSDF